MRSLRGRFGTLAATNALQTSLNLLTGILVARALGPALRGELASITIIATVAGTILPLGLPQALVTWRGPIRRARGLLILHLALVFLLGVLVFIFAGSVGQQTPRWWQVVAGATLVTGGASAALATGLAQRIGHFGLSFRAIRLLPGLLSVTYMLILWKGGVSSLVAWLALAAGVSFVPTALLYRTFFRRALNSQDNDDQERVGTLINLSLASAFAVLGAQLLYRIDSLIVAVALPHAQIAYYAVAFGAQTACLSIAQAGAMLAFSDLRQAFDLDGRRRALRRALLPTAALSGILALGAVVVAPFVVPLAYGSAFGAAVHVTQVLAVAAVPLSLDYVFLHALIVERAQRSTFLIQLLILSIGAPSLAIAATHGTLTVAWVMVCVVTVSCIINGARVSRMMSGSGAAPQDRHSQP